MTRYIVRRLLIMIPSIIGITFISYMVLSLAPGDPLLARTDPSIIAQQPEEYLEQRREALGLHHPVPVQYVYWLADVVRGDLGYSVATGRPISGELALRLPATLQLMGAAILIGIVIGVPSGVVSAIRQYSKWDYILTGFTMFMICTPSFFLGLLAIYVFGVQFAILPTGGTHTLGEDTSILDSIQHTILPASILGFLSGAIIMRYTRASMLDVLHKEYVTTAVSKGLPNRRVLFRHALPNGMLPVITVIGLNLPDLIAGAVITEQIFGWPGMGQMAVRAASDRDPSMLMGVVLVVGIGVLVINLIVDITYAAVDPRIKYE